MPTRRPIDHVPIILKIKYKLEWMTHSGAEAKGRTKWDYDKLARCIQYGEHRAPFLEDYCRRLTAAQNRLRELDARPSPDEHWEHLLNIIRDTAAEHFTSNRPYSEEYSELAKIKRNLLKIRFEARTALAKTHEDDDQSQVDLSNSIKKATKLLRKERETYWNNMQEIWTKELDEAWLTRDFHTVHALTITCRFDQRTEEKDIQLPGHHGKGRPGVEGHS